MDVMGSQNLGFFVAGVVIFILVNLFRSKGDKKAEDLDEESDYQLDPEAAEQISDWVSRKVREGFDSRDEIIEGVSEMIEDDYEGWHIAHEVEKETDRKISEHRVEQSSWPVTTDCDRIDAAFYSLEAEGIVGRQNFSCCQTCGSAEILDELEEFSRDYREPAGFTYFHMQDTEMVAESGTLYLAYGSNEGDPVGALEVGNKISTALTAQGLTVDWDGTLEQRICITNLDWKKRRLMD